MTVFEKGRPGVQPEAARASTAHRARPVNPEFTLTKSWCESRTLNILPYHARKVLSGNGQHVAPCGRTDE